MLFTVSQSSEKMTIVLSVSFAVVFLIGVALFLVFLLWRRYHYPKSKQFSKTNGFRHSHATDMELAVLREMPRVAMHTNALYSFK